MSTLHLKKVRIGEQSTGNVGGTKKGTAVARFCN